MKKIIAIFVLLMAFTIGATAQTAKTKEIVNESVEAKAKQNVKDLNNNMDITDQKMFDALYQLFLNKHKDLETATSETEKTAISKIIDAKLRATFNDNQIKELQRVEGLYDKLIK